MLPAGIGVHLPMEDGSAQLRHAPMHESAQQTPSTQLPDWHSPALAQS
jgi:hypothetical protein